MGKTAKSPVPSGVSCFYCDRTQKNENVHPGIGIIQRVHRKQTYWVAQTAVIQSVFSSRGGATEITALQVILKFVFPLLHETLGCSNCLGGIKVIAVDQQN